MKKCSSVFRMALAAIVVSAAGAFCLPAGAQTSSNVIATPAPPAASASQAPALPYGVGEVVKMYQGGVSKEVIVHYINNTILPYHLTADGIIHLQNLAVPQEIIHALIERDGHLQQQALQQQQAMQQQQGMQQYYQQQAAAAQASGQTPPPTADSVAPTTPAPPVTVIGSDYPAYYDAGYPYYYGWPYYGPVVVGGWGWGGRGWGGYHGGVGGFRGGGGFHGGGGLHGFGGFGGHGGGGGGGHR